MRIAIDWGRQRLELESAPGQRLTSLRGPTELADPTGAVRAALEAPFGFPPLRRALTPDDRVAVLVDERLPDLPGLLTPLLQHIASAGVAAEAVTLVCPSASARAAWIDELPDEFDGVCVEIHDPKDRRHLSYLATTSEGRRLYLNRTIIDADQVVVLTGRRYDPWLGYGGAEGDLFPALVDQATRDALLRQPDGEVPDPEPGPLRQEAMEVSWLLGQPFYVQIIAAAGDGVAHVVAGAGDACREGDRLLDAGWRPNVARRPSAVVAALSGDPSRHTFADLAGALAAAARIVQPNGRIILLTEAAPALGPGMDLLRTADEPQSALAALEKQGAPETAPALWWAQAACHARLSILSPYPEETIEELFASPLADLAQVQRLVASSDDCLVLRDAQRMMAVLA